MLLWAAAHGIAMADGSGSSVPLAATADAIERHTFDLSIDHAGEDARETLLRNPDALVRAKLRLTLSQQWLFVYADVGSGTATLAWQSLVGIRISRGTTVLGGWRHTTYYFSPGSDFESLGFNGAFVGAQGVW